MPGVRQQPERPSGFFVMPGIFMTGCLVVQYLADPRAFDGSLAAVVGAIGLVGGFFILLAVAFNKSMRQMKNTEKLREKPSEPANRRVEW